MPVDLYREGAKRRVSAVGFQLLCAQALDLGKSTLGKIRQNLAWALVYNLVGIPLAAGALLPAFDLSLGPAAAAGMMAFSSVAVVTNSLLLRGADGKGGSRLAAAASAKAGAAPGQPAAANR